MMIEKRRAELMGKLEDAAIDFALVTSPVHIFYLTGFASDPHERFFALLLDVYHKTTHLFLPELDYEKSRQTAEVDNIIPIKDTEHGFTVVRRTVDSQACVFGIEKNVMTLRQFEELKAVYPNSSFPAIDDLLQTMRLKKSSGEIEQVKQAVALTEKGLNHIKNFVKIGMTEIEVKMELEYHLHAIGAEKMAFETTVLTGANASLPHGTSGLRKIKAGDFLLFDFGVTVNGYHSDITRTFLVNQGTKEQIAMYETVKEANERAIRAVKVGRPLKEIDLAARNFIAQKGYGNYFTHRIGHGLGLEVHEPPSLHEQNDMPVQKGMLFTIEPGIYIPDLGGVRIEDDVYVNEAGEIEVLTTYPKELQYIEG